MNIDNYKVASALLAEMETCDQIIRDIWNYEDSGIFLCTEKSFGLEKIIKIPQSAIDALKKYYSDEYARLKKEFEKL